MKKKFSQRQFKIIISAILCTFGLPLFAQVTIPSNYLNKVIKKVEQNRAYALQDSIDLNTPTFYFLPSIKHIDIFENDSTKFLSKNILSYNDSLSNIALYSEIASDYLGPVRVSVGITFAYPKTDTNSLQQAKINREKFIQRFSTAGGAVVFNFILPIISYNSKLFGMDISLGPKYSIDPPSFGVTTDKFIHNTSLGTDFQCELRGIKNVFRFYANGRISYVAGNSTFYSALQLTDPNRRAFWLNNYTIGVKVKDVFTLSYTKFWGTKYVSDKLAGYLTFTVEPNFQ